MVSAREWLQLTAVVFSLHVVVTDARNLQFLQRTDINLATHRKSAGPYGPVFLYGLS